MARLSRASIRFRHPVNGQMFVDGHEAEGIGVVRFAQFDAYATESVHSRWSVQSWAELSAADQRRREAALTSVVTRDGFVLVHTLSGRWLTPATWNLPDRQAVTACLRALIDGAPQGKWHQPAPMIAHLGGLVIGAHRDAGAFTGAHDHVRRLGAAIDEAAYAEKLAGLRAGSPCDDWTTRGPQDWAGKDAA